MSRQPLPTRRSAEVDLIERCNTIARLSLIKQRFLFHILCESIPLIDLDLTYVFSEPGMHRMLDIMLTLLLFVELQTAAMMFVELISQSVG
ncbi:hypothetical protein N7510_011857 [Penicillium lagena]|uniref:uncharacterized protein n=1 Tax=Penicillium lagena TaxID=94218 RepID=UPI00253FE826|nr:uncharacterized protein N7510_011857 [Penicillium lagena]KAJ5598907.1 hypothetical protein N7510_011857 [Penicillium lagena]